MLLPVFRSIEDGRTILTYQIIGDKNKIAAFIEDPDLRLRNLITLGHEISSVTVNIGDMAIRAYEGNYPVDKANLGFRLCFDRPAFS